MSKSALSLAVAGSLIASTAYFSSSTLTKENTNKVTNFSVMEPTKATPELVEYAKKNGIDLSKHDQVRKLLNTSGAKFQQAGNNHVTFKDTGADVPMLVLLVQFANETAPLGAPKERVNASYFDDLIFGTEYNPYELPQFKKYDGPNVPKDRTMQNIYKENSYGKVKLSSKKGIADVGWVTLPKNAEDYLSQSNGDFDNENGFAHMGELITDLMAAADEQLDFTEYAVETENGLVLPNVFVVHAGTGGEWSGDPAQIWSHKWDVPSAMFWGNYYQTGNLDFADENKDGNVDSDEENKWIAANEHKWTYDGVQIGTYGIQPELGGNISGFNATTGSYDENRKTGPYPAQPGVFAHEFGHVLGLPDYYDTDYTSEGVGDFSMMSGGSWLSYPATSSAYLGNTPAGFDPFSKMFLGWANPIEVKQGESRTITLKPVNQAGPNDGFVKMEVPGSNGTEYFLFENIQQVGYNKGYGEMGENAHGLVAWHVDENILSLYQTAGARVNNVENWMNKRFQNNQSKVVADGQGNPVELTHYGLSIIQADGNYDLERYNNRGDAGDFFKPGDNITPISSNVHTGSFYFWKGNGSTPADSGIHVTNIKENKDGSITAKFYYNTNSSKN